MKKKKIEREFQLSDSSVNVYGFRLLTLGYQRQEYEKNPIGYFMHQRENGVLLRWEELRVDGDQILGKPVINLSHPRAEQTIAEIESGFLNAASFGHLVILEFSDDPALKLTDQVGPTVTKWYNKECSLVDIPGNINSLAKLFDQDGNELNLSDFTHTHPIMKQLILTADMLSALQLKAESSEVEAALAFTNLVSKAARTDTAESELQALKATTLKAEITAVLDKALEVDKKITKELSLKLEKDYATNPQGLKDLLAVIPTTTSIIGQINSPQNLSDHLKDKTWDDLHKEGLLENLKANFPAFYTEKFKEKFSHEPKKNN